MATKIQNTVATETNLADKFIMYHNIILVRIIVIH